MNTESPVNKKRRTTKAELIIAIIGAILIIFGFVSPVIEKAVNNSKLEASTVKSAPKSEPISEIKTEPIAVEPAASFVGLSQDEAIKLAVSEAVGSDSYIGHQIEGNALMLTVKLSDNWTENMIRKGGLADSLAIAELVEEHAILGDLSELNIAFEIEMTDVYGNQTLDKALEVRFSAETLAKINYDGMLVDNVPTIADYYWQHPSFDE